MKYRLLLHEKLRGFRSWIEARDTSRFTMVVFAMMALGLVVIVMSSPTAQGSWLAARDWVGTLLLVVLELLFLHSFLKLLSPEALEDNNLLLVVTILFLAFAASARLLLLPEFSPYLIPTAALGMLSAVILNLRAGLLLVILGGLNVGLLTGFELSYTVVALVMGLFSLQPMLRLDQRTKFLTATGNVIVTGAAAILGAELLLDTPVVESLGLTLWAIPNGILSLVLTVSLLIVFEAAFNLTTPIRLLELANPAHPLLRRLMQVAPGTYNHSILMGNLAEAAAEAIGANALLARVGAYYHDIGKVMRPEYFIENQLHIKNPHDKLNPNISRLAITAHVRDGGELAKEYGLPRPITDIIRQHHGTSVLSYFYQKAKETSVDAVAEESYRYEAEKPHSKEAAIIMLADSVEAAVKAMKSPTPKKLQGLISEVIKQKVDDGQLDQSGLSLGDLNRIREVFETSLWGVLGGRIPYPSDNGRQERRVQKAAVGGAGGGFIGGERKAGGALGGGPGRGQDGGPGGGSGADAPGGGPIAEELGPNKVRLRAVPSSSRYGSPSRYSGEGTDVVRRKHGESAAFADTGEPEDVSAPDFGEGSGLKPPGGGAAREVQATGSIRDVQVDVSNETPVRIRERAVKQLVRAVLNAEGAEGEVAVAFIEKNGMATLNRRFRNVAEPTDVLAFPELNLENQPEWPEVDDEARNRLGDVVICPGVAAMYAAEEGTPLGEELRRLVVHGTLHLLGYDHEVDQGEMRSREVQLLASVPPASLITTE